MGNFVLDQLGFVRRQTVDYVRSISDSSAEIVPTGLNNNIKWNLGHMYVVLEKFAFRLTGEETKVPTNFSKLFDPGTKPSDWDAEPPTMSQIINLLTEQIDRVESVLASKLKEEITPHYKSSTGLTYTTVEQLLGFLIYHEAMHFATIKNIRSIIKTRT
ncbi:hypothetical protein A3842_27890 [Paenibacillus sp. P3E]|uniref:DinB family protein n=1 Tax=Paenibacillus sp. P3E TaxID=1349435 RepID=UPI00093D47CE|nr:DinB family protein [Paenibacillus sp. P3E]OKP67699.1 hypothetical protein A3842_27890 [Paenibacillus sp. P3E]